MPQAGNIRRSPEGQPTLGVHSLSTLSGTAQKAPVACSVDLNPAINVILSSGVDLGRLGVDVGRAFWASPGKCPTLVGHGGSGRRAAEARLILAGPGL